MPPTYLLGPISTPMRDANSRSKIILLEGYCIAHRIDGRQGRVGAGKMQKLKDAKTAQL